MHYMEGTSHYPPAEGFETLLNQLPDTAQDFPDTDLGQPAAMAYFANRTDIDQLKRKAGGMLESPAPDMCETAMVMAEAIESVQSDRDEYFITDAKTRGHVFMGAKWRAGWACILGNGDKTELVKKLQDKSFLVFAQNGKNQEDVIDLGPRETASVYFLQLMVRYAMYWGEIEPGNDHEMGHYLEVDMPGAVIAVDKLTPVEELLILSLMKMGAPAILPKQYTWDLGRQKRIEDVDEIVNEIASFPNMREKEVDGKTLTLPDFYDPANAKEKIEHPVVLGDEYSFLILKPGNAEEGTDLPENDNLREAESIGISVEIGDDKLDIQTSEYLENAAVKQINNLKGIQAFTDKEDKLILNTAPDVLISADQISQAIQSGLRGAFPYLKDIHITIETDTEKVTSGNKQAKEYRQKRKEIIENEIDEDNDYFHYCIECQPFSREHVCVITPTRPPMCGKNPFLVRSASLFGATWHPWKRRDVEDGTLQGVLEKGETLDSKGGEYSTINETIQKLSRGYVKRVKIHSVKEFPHTSCGCFQFLAFWIEKGNGIGVMERGYEGQGPDGITWDTLANKAGGKQAPGVVGVSGSYLKSQYFLKGDGGHANVKWLSPKAFKLMKDLLPNPDNVEVPD